MLLMMMMRLGLVGDAFALLPAFGARNSEIASWVVRMGCVMLMSRVA